ncbi:DUF1566 domain-containing protein [uncultured Thiothrix sp.]|uniref:Lcl C-terminal domain-containing protein n=1 Tax=uncultured Thiothrix sp. TaxID=223185 RepID=UPI002607F0F2|nr:DUF1566 domain-containing protein [uncultured Thiothrix sp.]
MFTLKHKLALNFIFFLLITNSVHAEQSCSSNMERSNSLNQFQDNGNGTISDQKTHLMWQKCPIGQTGNDCSGEPEVLTWLNALNKAVTLNNNNYANYSDWRMPNMKELSTLVERSCMYPAINLENFPNTGGYQLFWTSTTLIGNPGSVIGISFTFGTPEAASKTSTRSLRLVRNL